MILDKAKSDSSPKKKKKHIHCSSHFSNTVRMYIPQKVRLEKRSGAAAGFTSCLVFFVILFSVIFIACKQKKLKGLDPSKSKDSGSRTPTTSVSANNFRSLRTGIRYTQETTTTTTTEPSGITNSDNFENSGNLGSSGSSGNPGNSGMTQNTQTSTRVSGHIVVEFPDGARPSPVRPSNCPEYTEWNLPRTPPPIYCRNEQ